MPLRLYVVPLPMPWLLSHLLMEPWLQRSLISFNAGVKSSSNFSTDHLRSTSKPSKKCLLEETQKNVKQLQAGEVPVPDGIPLKIFKEGGEVIAVKLTELILQFGTRA